MPTYEIHADCANIAVSVGIILRTKEGCNKAKPKG